MTTGMPLCSARPLSSLICIENRYLALRVVVQCAWSSLDDCMPITWVGQHTTESSIGMY